MAEADLLVRSACLCALPNARISRAHQFAHEIRFDAKPGLNAGNRAASNRDADGANRTGGERWAGDGQPISRGNDRGEFIRAWTGVAAKPASAPRRKLCNF